MVPSFSGAVRGIKAAISRIALLPLEFDATVDDESSKFAFGLSGPVHVLRRAAFAVKKHDHSGCSNTELSPTRLQTTTRKFANLHILWNQHRHEVRPIKQTSSFTSLLILHSTAPALHNLRTRAIRAAQPQARIIPEASYLLASDTNCASTDRMPPKLQRQKTIEEQYQKLSQLEHILLRQLGFPFQDGALWCGVVA